MGDERPPEPEEDTRGAIHEYGGEYTGGKEENDSGTAALCDSGEAMGGP
jgi:hypothetical protein